MWDNWKWQEEKSFCDVKEYLGDEVNSRFNMRITPYYDSLFDRFDENDPLRKQAVPDEREETLSVAALCEEYGINVGDSLGEVGASPVPHLVHRYPDRVMVEVTSNCFMYCRFCTRKRVTSVHKNGFDLVKAYEYIRQHKEIRDVLVSGGDPLTLQDEEIVEILKNLRSIPHVEIIRIGTRTPVVNPMRITDELVEKISKYKPIWINSHFNHPRELTPEAMAACGKIIDSGIPMNNQSVLLKGVNDDKEIMRKLCVGLVKNRIRPYYLYQCDIGMGNEHFRTSVEKGLEIIGFLRQTITGFAVPLYIIDAPNNGGKFVVENNWMVEHNANYVTLKNKEGKTFCYPQVKDYE